MRRRGGWGPAQSEKRSTHGAHTRSGRSRFRTAQPPWRHGEAVVISWIEERRAGVPSAGVHARLREPDERIRVGAAQIRAGRRRRARNQHRRAAGQDGLGDSRSAAISFDLLSDFHPHGEVAQKYGVFRPREGFSERAIFVIDKQGKDRLVAGLRTFPSSRHAADVFDALSARSARVGPPSGAKFDEVKSKVEDRSPQPPTNLGRGRCRPGSGRRCRPVRG